MFTFIKTLMGLRFKTPVVPFCFDVFQTYFTKVIHLNIFICTSIRVIIRHEYIQFYEYFYLGILTIIRVVIQS